MLLNEFDRRGMSGAAFAELIGIKYQTFATWRQRRERKRIESSQPSEAGVLTPAAPMQWAEAVVQSVFVFTNRRHTRLKILYRDGTGLWVMIKRLEAGTFSWPSDIEPGTTKLRLRPEALAMLTDGIDLRGAKMRPWYECELLENRRFSRV